MMTTDAWRSKTFYQIYPMTFADSNGDGMGDLQGVISKLDYLVDLGIGYLWLTPIYVSPCYDNGYDIADYRAIDPKFGTMSDFEELLSAAHDRGLGVIMDMVVNHTSTEHRWFKEALSDPTSPYRDYYIWRDPVDGGAPNNWRSKFGGSAWELDSASGQYYLHLYEVHQADLNWENPRVREEVIDIMLFGLKKASTASAWMSSTTSQKTSVFWMIPLRRPLTTGELTTQMVRACTSIFICSTSASLSLTV